MLRVLFTSIVLLIGQIQETHQDCVEGTTTQCTPFTYNGEIYDSCESALTGPWCLVDSQSGRTIFRVHLDLLIVVGNGEGGPHTFGYPCEPCKMPATNITTDQSTTTDGSNETRGNPAPTRVSVQEPQRGPGPTGRAGTTLRPYYGRRWSDVPGQTKWSEVPRYSTGQGPSRGGRRRPPLGGVRNHRDRNHYDPIKALWISKPPRRYSPVGEREIEKLQQLLERKQLQLRERSRMEGRRKGRKCKMKIKRRPRTKSGRITGYQVVRCSSRKGKSPLPATSRDAAKTQATATSDTTTAPPGGQSSTTTKTSVRAAPSDELTRKREKNRRRKWMRRQRLRLRCCFWRQPRNFNTTTAPPSGQSSTTLAPPKAVRAAVKTENNADNGTTLHLSQSDSENKLNHSGKK